MDNFMWAKDAQIAGKKLSLGVSGGGMFLEVISI